MLSRAFPLHSFFHCLQRHLQVESLNCRCSDSLAVSAGMRPRGEPQQASEKELMPGGGENCVFHSTSHAYRHWSLINYNTDTETKKKKPNTQYLLWTTPKPIKL